MLLVLQLLYNITVLYYMLYIILLYDNILYYTAVSHGQEMCDCTSNSRPSPQVLYSSQQNLNVKVSCPPLHPHSLPSSTSLLYLHHCALPLSVLDILYYTVYTEYTILLYISIYIYHTL